MALPSTSKFLEYQIELSSMLGSLSKAKISSFGRLKIALPWCSQSVNWPMLQAATHFWHSHCHLFRFGLDELSPTYEEFSAIMGFPLLSSPGTVNYRRRSRDALTEFLGLPEAQARRVTPGGCIHMTSVVRLFSQRDEEDQAYSMYRLHAVTLCLTSFLLLVTGAELVDSSVVHIAKGIAAGYSPIPVILAETLNSLDAYKEDPEVFLRGSLMLLSIWLMEHFQLVVPPTRALPVPDQFFTRFLVK